MPGTGISDDSARSLPRKCCDSALGMSLNHFLWLGCIQTQSVNIASLVADRGGVMAPPHILPARAFAPTPSLHTSLSMATLPPPSITVA